MRAAVDVEMRVPDALGLYLRTAEGDIEARDLTGHADLSTDRGIVVFRGTLTDGEHRLRSAHGRIELWLDSYVCARIVARTTKGTIEDSSLIVRGPRTGNSWDVNTVCFDASLRTPDGDPPTTIHLDAEPGNIYLLSWMREDE
jgi:hypothetical protein